MKNRAFRILATSGVAVALIASGLLATFVPAAAAAADEGARCACPLMAAAGACEMPPGLAEANVASCCSTPDVPPALPVDEALPQAPQTPAALQPATLAGAVAAPPVPARPAAAEASPTPVGVPLFTLHASFLL